MRWPWERYEEKEKREQQIIEHTEEQDIRIKEAQSLINDTRDHSDEELKRAHSILDKVRNSERALAEMYDEADQELRGD